MAVPTFTHKFVQLGPDVRIHAVVSNPPLPDAPSTTTTNTLVFLHFWGGSTRTWDRVISSPGNLALRCPTIALDFRGWGQSTGPAEDAGEAGGRSSAHYSIATLASDVEAALPQLMPDSASRRFVLVGLSMGAKVAQLVAARNAVPGLQGIALVSPAPPTPLLLPPDMQEQQKQAYETAESAEFVARNVLTATFRGDGGASSLPQSLVEDMLRGNAAARAAWPAYGMAEDVSQSTKEAGGVKGPILVLAAEHDTVEPPARVKAEVFDKLPADAMKLYKVIPSSGHLSPVDAPEALVECLSQTIVCRQPK